MQLLKQLRAEVGAPMNECQASLKHVATAHPALTDAKEIIQKAIEYLREKGSAVAAKKAGKAATEGLLGLSLSSSTSSSSSSSHSSPCSSFPTSGALVELNSETDFATRNPAFQQLVLSVAAAASSIATAHTSTSSSSTADILTPTLSATTPADRTPVATAITNLITSLRENIHLRRAAAIQLPVTKGDGVLGFYMHNSVEGVHSSTQRVGKSAAIVAVVTDAKTKQSQSQSLSEQQRSQLFAFANKLAMHIVAAKTPYANVTDVPAEVLTKEKQIIATQMEQVLKGKSEPQQQRILEGKLNKFYEENVLSHQKFLVVSGDEKPQTISAVLAQQAKEIGVSSLTIPSFVRYHVGEGMLVSPKQSFADEVASKLNQ